MRGGGGPNAHLNLLAVIVKLQLAVVRLKPQLAPQRLVACLQVAEHLPRARADLRDERTWRQLAARLGASPKIARHDDAVLLLVLAGALVLEDGLDPRDLPRRLRRRGRLRHGVVLIVEGMLDCRLVLVRVVQVAIPRRQLHPVARAVRVVGRVLDADEPHRRLLRFFAASSCSWKFTHLRKLDCLRPVMLSPLGLRERASRRAAEPRAGHEDFDGHIHHLLALVLGDLLHTH